MKTFTQWLEASEGYPVYRGTYKHAGMLHIKVGLNGTLYTYHCYDSAPIQSIIRQFHVVGAGWRALNRLKKEAIEVTK